ncbi:Calmodulin-3 [Gracilaria domingensis]|nr:Calmodulin-3 [Gracilaria domingensis]
MSSSSSAPNLSDDENLRAVFDVFDPSGKGCVPVDRIGSIIRAAGEFPTEATVNELVNREVRRKHKKPSASEVEAAFRTFDSSPYVTVADLKKTLTQFGEKLSEEEVDRLVTLVGTTEDGRVDKKEMAMRLTS